MKARTLGCKERHASKTQLSSKRHESAAELSLVESNGSDRDLSKPLSNTVLKSPHTSVGTDGSTQETHPEQGSCWERKDTKHGKLCPETRTHRKRAVYHHPFKTALETGEADKAQHSHTHASSQKRPATTNGQLRSTNDTLPQKHNVFPASKLHPPTQAGTTTNEKHHHVCPTCVNHSRLRLLS